MNRTRLVLVSVLSGVVLSFTTGLSPAGADHGSERYRTTGETFTGSESGWYVEHQQFTHAAGGTPTCVGNQVYSGDTTYSAYVTGWAPDPDPTDFEQKGYASGPDSRACSLIEFWPHGNTDLLGTMRAESATSSNGVECELYLQRLSPDGASQVGSISLLKAINLGPGTPPMGTAGEGFGFEDLEDRARYRILAFGYDVDPGDTCGVEDINMSLWHPDDMQEPGPPDSFVPRLSCGRTMRDMGNGQWYADAEAIIRNPTSTATDSQGQWTVSWSADTYPGRNATIALPPSASEAGDFFATYTMRRTSTQVIGWSEAQETGSEWVSNPEIHDGTPFAYTLPGAWLFADFLGDGEPTDTGGFHVGFDADGDGVVGDVIPPQPITQVKSVEVACTMRVSPVSAHRDPVLIEINIPPHPDDPDQGGGGEPDPDEASQECNDSPIWKFWDWPDKLLCLTGGLLDVLGDLLSWLRDTVWNALQDFGLGDFGIPNLAADWGEKFPLSVVSEAVSAFGALDTALDSGMTDSCGPTFEPDVSNLPGLESSDDSVLSVSLPSPNAACNQSEFATQAADLGGFRTPLRSFFVVLLWAGFLVKVATSIGPGRSGIEPTDDGT